MITIKLSHLRDLEANHPGTFSEFVSAGRVAGDVLQIERADFERISRGRFGGIQLGTVVHRVAAPVAALLDAALGTKLSNCGDCAGRELKLNAFPSK